MESMHHFNSNLNKCHPLSEQQTIRTDMDILGAELFWGNIILSLYIDYTMTISDLAKQVARPSAAVVLTSFSQNIPALAS